jgi:OOP family OmpA-OmpF porin
VVTESGRRGGKYFVNGLRDPLAADPVAMLGVHRLSPAGVRSVWKPYQALDPEIVAARARHALEAPASVLLQVRGGALVAAGSAPSRWIREARSRARAIGGITGYDDRALAGSETIELERLKSRIEGRVILFALGSSEVSPAEEVKIRETSDDARALSPLAAELRRGARLEVIGRGDSVGTEEVNLGISSRRADRVAAALAVEGIGALALAPSGVGSTRPIRPEVTEKDRELNRSVSFRVVLADAPGQESPRR